MFELYYIAKEGERIETIKISKDTLAKFLFLVKTSASLVCRKDKMNRFPWARKAIILIKYSKAFNHYYYVVFFSFLCSNESKICWHLLLPKKKKKTERNCICISTKNKKTKKWLSSCLEGKMYVIFITQKKELTFYNG